MSTMPFVPFDNVAKVEIVCLYNGQYVENVLNYWVEDGIGPTTLEDIAVAVKTAWSTQIKTWISNRVSLQSIKVTSLETQFSPGIEYTTGLPLTGDDTAEAMPNNVAACITWLTANRGKSYRGRSYFYGLGKGNITDNTMETSLLGHLSDSAEALIALDLPGDSDAVLVVASRMSNNTPRTVGLATPVTGFKIDPTIDSQRRRLPGRGR